tara:strand:+ start:433 stop:1182 length:750 start_codon:yes stop_codon:yes gene_type:complete
MKYVRFNYEGRARYGIVENNYVRLISCEPFSSYKKLNKINFLESLEILPPTQPTKVIALGYNYKDLVGQKDQYDEPVIFLKPPSSIIGHNQTIRIPTNSKVWTEVELAIVIGKQGSNIPIENAESYIFGYTIGNDVTMSNILNRDHHLARSKCLDTFCPLGPIIVTDFDIKSKKLANEINDKISQESNTRNMILNNKEIVSLVSSFMTLLPGDIILTGTPANAENSIIKSGDTVKVSIQGLGELVNKVI